MWGWQSTTAPDIGSQWWPSSPWTLGMLPKIVLAPWPISFEMTLLEQVGAPWAELLETIRSVSQVPACGLSTLLYSSCPLPTSESQPGLNDREGEGAPNG